MKTRVLSCIQPTGGLHIGNYFGAVKNWVQIQNEEKHDCIYGIVDLHAMTMPYDPRELMHNTSNMFIELLSCGIEMDKSILFVQSLVPEHTELAWVLGCVTSYGELSRMTQFKDKTEQLQSGGRDHFVSAGLFTYPVLQAADILVYRSNFVPVGKDQEQHLELSRNIAARFNAQFGQYFPEPEPLFTEIPKLVSLADPTKKMSKSLGEKHCVGLFETEESIRKKVRAAVTDLGATPREGEMSPGVENLFNILKSCGDEAATELLLEFRKGSLKYSVLKEAVANALVRLTANFKQAKANLEGERTIIAHKMKEMSDKASELARATIRDVRHLTGLAP